MKANLRKRSRTFSPLQGITLRDMGSVELGVDEQITFVTGSGRRNDVVQKEWGFYLSNSINANLKGQGFKLALVVSYASSPARLYLNLVETDKIRAFRRYLREVNAKVLTWLDEWLEASQADRHGRGRAVRPTRG